MTVSDIVAFAVVAVFIVLAAIHVYWAMGGRLGHSSAVPSQQGRPAFVPSATATLAVSVALCLCAVVVAAAARLITAPVPSSWITWIAYALALGLIARAIGDFRLVGFFKRVRDSDFARMDTAIYAPLCLVLGVAVFYVALVHPTS